MSGLSFGLKLIFCLIMSLVIIFGSAYVYYVLFYDPENVVTIGVVFLGWFLFIMTFATFMSGFNKFRNFLYLRKGLRGHAPEDGKRVAVIGKIVPKEDVLTTPISQTECVAYQYRVEHSTGTIASRRYVTSYLGFGLAPCSIQTDTSQVHLLGFPELVGFTDHTCNSPDERAQAETFFQTTRFEEGGIIGAVKFMQKVVEKERVSCTLNAHLTSRKYSSDHSLTETFVPEGTDVCAIGQFSSKKNALVPVGLTQTIGIQLIKGDGRSVVRRHTIDPIASFMVSIILLICSTYGIKWLMSLLSS